MRSKPTANEPDGILKWMGEHPILIGLLSFLVFFFLIFAGNHRLADALLGAALIGPLWTFIGLRARRLMRFPQGEGPPNRSSS